MTTIVFNVERFDELIGEYKSFGLFAVEKTADSVAKALNSVLISQGFAPGDFWRVTPEPLHEEEEEYLPVISRAVVFNPTSQKYENSVFDWENTAAPASIPLPEVEKVEMFPKDIHYAVTVYGRSEAEADAAAEKLIVELTARDSQAKGK